MGRTGGGFAVRGVGAGGLGFFDVTSLTQRGVAYRPVVDTVRKPSETNRTDGAMPGDSGTLIAVALRADYWGGSVSGATGPESWVAISRYGMAPGQSSRTISP